MKSNNLFKISIDNNNILIKIKILSNRCVIELNVKNVEK